MTLEAFLAQVAWPRVQLPSSKGGDTFGVADDDENPETGQIQATDSSGEGQSPQVEKDECPSGER